MVGFLLTVVMESFAQPLPPDAEDDLFLVFLGKQTPVLLPILANDMTPQGVLVPSSITIIAQPVGGTISIDTTTGVITYTPHPTFEGEEMFSYTVRNDAGLTSDTAIVLFTVLDAVNDRATIVQNSTLTLNVLANDIISNDFIPNPATLTIERQPFNGTVTNVNLTTGEITYQPNSGYAGEDSFVYKVEDNFGFWVAVATVFIDVRSPNQPPVARNDTVTTLPGTPKTISILANDDDPDGSIDPSTVTIIQQPRMGSAVVHPANGTITYTPNAESRGRDSLKYIVYDDQEEPSNVATVFILVNNPPFGLAMDFTTPVDSPLVIQPLTFVFDSDGFIDATTVTITRQPTRGVVKVDSVFGDITYTPNASVRGLDSLYFKVSDNDGAYSENIPVRILINNPPVAKPDSVFTARNRPVVIDVLANDTDSDGHLVPSSIVVELLPEFGSVHIDTTTGRITYTPRPGFAGVDLFEYGVADNDGAFSFASVVIRVVNAEPPVAVDDRVISLGSNTRATIALLANDSAHSPTLVPSSIVMTRVPTRGRAAVDTSTGVLTYIPNLNVQGPDTMAYTVRNDSGFVSNQALVTLTVRAAVNDAALTFSGLPVTIPVLANDLVEPDFPPDPSTVTIVEAPSHGTVTALDSATGAIIYRPHTAFAGLDTLVYRVNGRFGDIVAIASVYITVRPPNRNPVAVNDAVTLRLNTSQTIGVLANDSDPDGDPLTLESVSDPPNGTAVIVNDSIRYTPDMNFLGTDSFFYIIHDGFQGRDTATVFVEVISIAYDITDLGTLGGNVSRAYGLNELGYVVGASRTASGQIRAFRWSGGIMIPLTSPDTGSTQAFGINRLGEIVGARERNGKIEAVRWRDDTIASLAPSATELSIAYGINEQGVIAGVSVGTTGDYARAVVWEGGTLFPLDNTAQSSSAFGIREDGTVAGYLELRSQEPRAGAGTRFTGFRLFPSDTAKTRAYALNDSGLVVGSRQVGTTVTAVMWNEAGQRTTLASLGGSFSEAYALNHSGLMVGTSSYVQIPLALELKSRVSVYPGLALSASGLIDENLLFRERLFSRSTTLENLRATMWVRGGIAVDLNEVIPNTSEWILLEARGINAASQIIGTGLRNGEVRAFVLTPSSNLTPTVFDHRTSTVRGNTVVIHVLQGAVDRDGDRLRLIAVHGARHGAISFTADGMVTYTPHETFLGIDTLLYVVTDGRGALAQGRVIIRIGEQPAVYELAQNYPNPFNPATTISFSLPVQEQVELSLYNILGERVKVLVNDILPAGVHRVQLTGSGLATGVYFYTLRTGPYTATRKLVLLK